MFTVFWWWKQNLEHLLKPTIILSIEEAKFEDMNVDNQGRGVWGSVKTSGPEVLMTFTQKTSRFWILWFWLIPTIKKDSCCQLTTVTSFCWKTVKPLLLHIRKSQLRFLIHLYQMPPDLKASQSSVLMVISDRENLGFTAQATTLETWAQNKQGELMDSGD